MNDRLKLVLPLLIFLVLAVFLMLGLKKDPSELPSVLVGKAVPAFALPELSTGETLDASIFQGQPSLLNVWATWCPSCRAEHGYLMVLAQQPWEVFRETALDPYRAKWSELYDTEPPSPVLGQLV